MSEPDLAKGIHIPMSDVYEVVRAVDAREAELGIVPLENSIEGSVNATLDALTFESKNVLIEREVVIDVDLNLLGVAGSSLDSIEVVFTHPHALAQCRSFIGSNLPKARVEAAISTADAARRVADSADPAQAAVATKLAAELYGLHVIADGIADYPDNATRFVVLGRSIPPPSGHDKTTVVCFQAEDRPGSLLEILQEFAARSINLTKIESRPTKRGLGQYCFVVEFEGHLADAVVADALKHLHVKLAELKYLGSYPSASSGASEHRKRAEGAWAEADAFLEGLKARMQPPDTNLTSG